MVNEKREDMSYASVIMPELEQEMATTRRVLERVPEDKLDWKCHPKSNSIGWVANHLSEIPGWVAGTLAQDLWDLKPVGGEPYQTPVADKVEKILENFDANLASAQEAIQKADDKEFEKQWSLAMSGEILFTMPKIAVIRTWVLNHTIHHRAFLCCYLRMNDVPVPGVYGPSGDES